MVSTVPSSELLEPAFEAEPVIESALALEENGAACGAGAGRLVGVDRRNPVNHLKSP